MPANLLNLSAYRVLHVETNDHDYHIDAETIAPPTACPHCQASAIQGFGRREQMVKDLPMHGKRVGVYVTTRRYRCKACRKTFYEALPDVDDKRLMTRRLVDWIGRQAIKRTFASIAEEVGITEFTVRSVFNDYINALEKEIRFEIPKWMGIDEIHLIRPRCVISNIANNTIVDMLHNRNKDTVAKYLSRLPGRDQVRYVAMDMWNPYRDAVEAVLPDATIVIDKFHVLKMANEALEKVRKSMRESLSPKQRRGLMHDRFILLKREHDLNDQERFLLDGWVKNYPELGEAYRLKEDFYGIYNAASPQEARVKYQEWVYRVPTEVRDAYQPILTAWGNWMPYILAYFEHPITNSYTESLNSLIRVMNRLGRGYSFEALRAKILFAEGAFKRVNTRPKFERKPRESAAGYPPVMHKAGTRSMEFFVGTERTPYEIPGITPPKLKSTQPEESEKNYGVEISTLVRMIEAGEL